MSEWIKRSEQEPPRDLAKVLIFFCDGEIEFMDPDQASKWPWSHWQPISPPPRTVTIEISEEDARYFDGFNATAHPASASGRFYAACRRALEGK